MTSVPTRACPDCGKPPAPDKVPLTASEALSYCPGEVHHLKHENFYLRTSRTGLRHTVARLVNEGWLDLEALPEELRSYALVVASTVAERKRVPDRNEQRVSDENALMREALSAHAGDCRICEALLDLPRGHVIPDTEGDR